MFGYQVTKSDIVRNQRESFQPFFITEAGSGGPASICIEAAERLEGAHGMSCIALESIECEFGQVEAQVVQIDVLENPEYDPPKKTIVRAINIWTKSHVVWIQSDEMVEWLQAVPRNPADYT